MNKIIDKVFQLFRKQDLVPQVHFVIAAPRSGTTWLNTILNAHPAIYSTENRLFGNYADFVFDRGNEHPRLRVTLDKYVKSLLLHCNTNDLKKKNFEKQLTGKLIKTIIELELTYSKKPILIDKITPYLGTSEIVVSSISKYFPNSKIIYLVRDGRDVLTSGIFHWFTKAQSNDKFSFDKNLRNEHFLNKKDKLDRFFLDSEIKEWAKTWTEPIITAKHVRKRHAIHFIRYEEMLVNQELVLSKLFDFLNVEHDDKIISRCIAKSSFKKMTKNRRNGEEIATAHVRKGVAGDWRNYFTQKDAELFIEHAGQVLIDNNYEKNHDWRLQLPLSNSINGNSL